MRKFVLVALLLALLGCSKPPQLSTALDVEKKADDLIVLKLKIVNLENRPTTPIAVELLGQARSQGHWDKPASLLNPAAFVLNRKEQREITKFWRIRADTVRTTLVLKEQETGRLIKTEKTEKNW